ncbi:hypothetical protein ACFQ22_01485 [Lentilactobacillus raoultii]|uniref:Uncharacterized protein n=1 Tax=Lentilactobacillus raoultii TaxID=1987503 RepID=A0ABW3PLH7_9LACO|nr:hypothetical protein [Lentilactobacillus raoultii]
MAKYLKPQAEIVKSISEIAAQSTIFDLISYMGLPIIVESECEEIISFEIKSDFLNNSFEESIIEMSEINSALFESIDTIAEAA